jgi:hypothetical protein
LSEAVVRRVPVELMERKDMGVLCACLALTTVKERVDKMWTSPFWGGEVEGGAGAEMGREWGRGRQDKNCPQTVIELRQL